MRPLTGGVKTFTLFALPFAESTSSLSHRHGIVGLVIHGICLISAVSVPPEGRESFRYECSLFRVGRLASGMASLFAENL
jgi:hypothetical protein